MGQGLPELLHYEQKIRSGSDSWEALSCDCGCEKCLSVTWNTVTKGTRAELTSSSFAFCVSGAARPSLLSPSSLGLTLFPLGAATDGSGAALGRGFSSASTSGFFSGAGLGTLLCSGARRLLAGEGCRSGGATGSAGTGARWLAAVGWCRGEPLTGCFGAGIGIGAGSARLPSSSLWVWQFRHSHSFFCRTRKGSIMLEIGANGASLSPVPSRDGHHGEPWDGKVLCWLWPHHQQEHRSQQSVRHGAVPHYALTTIRMFHSSHLALG